MPSVNANNIKIEYETFGRESDKPLLMVMGLGAQMIAWDPEFCEMLADAGHFVIRYDNRDVGLSTHLDEHPAPNMEKLAMQLMAGEQPDVPYTLDDMAADGMALLSELGINQAHICGASLGGMIVQTMAINHPDQVLSMTSIMSTTGNPELPPATPEAMEALTSERIDDHEHVKQRAIAVSKVIGSLGFERDEERIARKALDAHLRAFNPAGVARQMAAVVAHGDRRPGLRKLNLPALVIHGAADPLVPVTGGQDTHENIPGSKLLVIDGMGHDLPMGTWDQIVTAINELTSSE